LNIRQPDTEHLRDAEGLHRGKHRSSSLNDRVVEDFLDRESPIVLPRSTSGATDSAISQVNWADTVVEFDRMKAEVEYSALVRLEVDLDTGEVGAAEVHAPADEDETAFDVGVSIENGHSLPHEVYDEAQRLVDAAAPFELHGWWAPGPAQRWTPIAETLVEASDDVDPDPPPKLHPPPAKAVGKPFPYAAAYADVLPESHREALRDAAVVYLDECFSAIADGQPGQSYAETMIGAYLPQRYEQYYNGGFARDWAAAVAVVGWKLAQPDDLTLSCVAEELALFALMQHAQVLLELRDQDNDRQAWRDFRDLALEDEDFLFLFTLEFDGIEDSDWGRENAVVGLKFNEWFEPFDPIRSAPHPFCLD
jgi:hypothetical protein